MTSYDVPESDWQMDRDAVPVQRLGATPQELRVSVSGQSCPDAWVLDNGDILFVGVDVTATTTERGPTDLRVGSDERAVVVPRRTVLSAMESLVGSSS